MYLRGFFCLIFIFIASVLPPIHGEWSEWSNWGQCSVTCQEGIQTRQRTCDNPPPAQGGNNCVGPPLEQTVCDEGPCPMDGGWSQYGAWSPCSQTCEEGIQIRRRTCTNPRPEFGGRDCEGPEREQQICRRRICPIHGGWSEWGAWSPCNSPRCGVNGSRFRSRSCTNPKPRHRGDYCVGPIIDRETCSKCITPGGWSDWGPWGPCSGSCRRGDFRLRFRICNNPPPRNGGSCEGNYREFGDCENLDPCPNNIDEGSGSGSGDGDDDPVDYVHWPCDDEDSCNPSPEKADEGSLSYSSSYSIHVPTDVAPVKEGCQDYSLYSYIFECGNNNVGGEDADEPDGGSQVEKSSSYDYSNFDNLPQGNPNQGNPNNEGDESYDYYDSVAYGNPGQGNGGHGGAQVGVQQGAEEESVHYSDSYSFDNKGVPGEAQPILPPPAGSDGGGSEPYSYYSSF